MSAVRRGWRARRNDENRASAEAHAELAQAVAERAAEHRTTAEYLHGLAQQAIWNNQRGTFTRETLAGATSIHTKRGWHIVCKLNAKSVTVRTWDATQTIPYAQIDDTRTQVPA